MFPFRIWKMNHNEKCFLKSDGFQRKIENSLNTYLPTYTRISTLFNWFDGENVRPPIRFVVFVFQIKFENVFIGHPAYLCVCVWVSSVFMQIQCALFGVESARLTSREKKNVIHCLWGKTPWKWYKGTVQMKWRRGSETSTPETQLSNV